MEQKLLNRHGLKWGLIIGLIYIVLLFLRYYTGEKNPMIFSMWALLSFIVVMVLLLVSGFSLRKKLGHLELKDGFKSLFISVLIFELFYAIFNFVYLKYVNPDFFIHFRDATEDMLRKANQSQAEIDKTLSNIDVDAPGKMNLFDLLKGYLVWVAISGVFAFLFALIIKRKKDPFHVQRENFLQS